MVTRALKDETWTHLMWIDSDIRFPKEAILAMITDDKPIIGGFYPKKGLPIDMASSPMPGGEETDLLFETDYVATGFMLIQRNVIETMIEKYPERQFLYQGDENFYDLYSPYIDTDMPNRLFLTEDYAFCRLARAVGFKSYMSKRFTLGHIGAYEYSWEGELQLKDEYKKKYGWVEPEKNEPTVIKETLDVANLKDLPERLDTLPRLESKEPEETVEEDDILKPF